MYIHRERERNARILCGKYIENAFKMSSVIEENPQHF